ncbi:MAG: hypothetical protein LLG44_02900 [Chloroflexi bacterium]|nr:hypothetical protein [Chloroflexota bacterium]
MPKALRIGIIGDYNPTYPSHRATDLALRHAAAALSVALECAWLATDLFAGASGAAALTQAAALWCAPGSPYRSMEGALTAIRFAREHKRPFIGT